MIVHLDADALFASVEQAADPKLRGRPVAVGGTALGVVTSASYEARKLGIYSLPTARARKIRPRLVVVPGDLKNMSGSAASCSVTHTTSHLPSKSPRWTKATST